MSEISDYLNDLFSGRKPIRRENPKPGQSGWYYMMPKSDDDYTDYDFIDVPDENTPNPRLQQSMVNQTQTPVLSSAIPAAGNWGSPVPTPAPVSNYIANDAVHNEPYGFGNTQKPQINNQMKDLPSNNYNNINVQNRNSNIDLGALSPVPVNVGNIMGATKDMVDEYFLMKSHKFKNLDDYYHCKANYNATQRGPLGKATSHLLGNSKEYFDCYWNQWYKELDKAAAAQDMEHDLGINQIGRDRFKSGKWKNAQDACADLREKNKDLPKEYW